MLCVSMWVLSFCVLIGLNDADLSNRKSNKKTASKTSYLTDELF